MIPVARTDRTPNGQKLIRVGADGREGVSQGRLPRREVRLQRVSRSLVVTSRGWTLTGQRWGCPWWEQSRRGSD